MQLEVHSLHLVVILSHLDGRGYPNEQENKTKPFETVCVPKETLRAPSCSIYLRLHCMQEQKTSVFAPLSLERASRPPPAGPVSLPAVYWRSTHGRRLGVAFVLATPGRSFCCSAPMYPQIQISPLYVSLLKLFGLYNQLQQNEIISDIVPPLGGREASFLNHRGLDIHFSGYQALQRSRRRREGCGAFFGGRRYSYYGLWSMFRDFSVGAQVFSFQR